MKRSINIVTLAILIFAGAMFFYLFRSSETVNASTAFSGFPINEPRVISFDVNHEALEDKSKREKKDQVRDWLLYAVVSDSGRSVEELGSEVLFDLPATRDKYMHAVGNFEYGETRSRLIKDEVVALVPADNPSERIDQLAHIADEHRKNSGDLPKSVTVFDYKLNVDDNQIGSSEITRREAIDGKELFTAKYGYYESRIKNLEDLKQFLKQVDDVVFAQQDGDALKLGGRKILGRSYRGIRVEDIAAIWQSEEKIQRGERLVDGSGFSLDPTYNFDKLKNVFETTLVPFFEEQSYELEDVQFDKEAWLQERMKRYQYQPSSDNLATVKAGFDRCDVGPFFSWLDSFRATHPEEVQLFEALFSVSQLTKTERAQLGLPQKLVEAFVRNQQARYDGDLKGTEVGMILFYTDLMAKLWGFDYKHSSPTQIEDFRSGVEIERYLSPAFQRTESEHGRLWFGPDDRGYQAGDQGRLAFARKATRLFAKTSSSISQRNEVEAFPSLATFINWWDDHYEEVARFEPEYERLNQIMKWSLLISWLNQAGKGSYLQFLNENEVTVYNKHRFPEWAKQQPDLKFNKWDAGMFLATPGPCTGTEMLPEFSSEKFVPLGERPEHEMSLSGGVSLSSKSLFRARHVLTADTKVVTAARRSGLNYDPLVSTGRSLKTLEGTAHEFQPLATNRFAVASTPRAEAMLRTPYGDLASGKFQHVLTTESNALKVTANYGDTGIGTLSISRTRNGFNIGWQSRELDLSQSVARKLSVSANPDEVLTANPMVESALKLPGNEGYLVKLHGSDQWTRLMAQNKPLGPLEFGWHARVADLQASSKPMNVGFWDQAKVNAEFAESHYIAIITRQSPSNGRVLGITREAPTTGGTRVTIVNGEHRIEAIVDPHSNSLFVKFRDLPESFQKNPGQLQRSIARADIEQLPRDGVLHISHGQGGFGRELANKNYKDLTKQLTDSPKEFKSALENHLNEALKQSDYLLANSEYGSLKRKLDDLIEVYGPRPELTIRRGVAQIKNGETASAARAFNDSFIHSQAPQRTVFFDEVNLRLQKGSHPSETLVQFADEGQTFASHCQIKTLPKSTRVGTESIDLDSAVVYVEKNSRLNNLDWNTNIEASLKQVISGEFGEVIKLPRGELNKFRPTEIYSADTGRSFQSVRQTTTKYNLRLPTTVGPGSRCQDDSDASSNGCGDIYIVRERPQN